MEVSELQQKFELTQILSAKYNFKLTDIFKFLDINKSSYYYWLNFKDNKILKEKNDIEVIKEIFNKGKQKLGYRRIQMHLEKDYEIKMNTKKIRRLMKKYQLITKIRHKNPYREIMYKGLECLTYPNILNRNFKKEKPNKYYLTDITYLHYLKGQKAYLSAIKDMVTGEIIAHKVSKHITLPLVINTIEKFKTKMNELNIDTKGIILHSDQGFHYTNPEYQNSLKKLGIIQSMSRKGNAIDNAPMESFFGHFKDEVDYETCNTFEELVDLIDEYMYYYNNKRYQWDKLKMTPVEYRSHLIA